MSVHTYRAAVNINISNIMIYLKFPDLVSLKTLHRLLYKRLKLLFYKIFTNILSNIIIKIIF